MKKLLYWLSARRPCRLIHSGNQRYLERYYLGQLFGLTFYLHRFVAADGDRALHDHPWRMCLGICLAGGYRERRLRWLDPEKGLDCVIRQVRPGAFNWISASTFHQIESVRKETWTLFIHTRKIKQWGFIEKVGHSREGDTTSITPVYVSDRDTSSHSQWWKTAPSGAHADRAPLNLASESPVTDN